ncbi:histidine phosphatase family protein [Sulfolobales archaeon HS-7]|nr:histidine phosphatase family protein [Sulfolobales archaeon HS-7]
MGVIVFIRHGQSVSNVMRILTCDNEGYPLTDEGISQSQAVANEIAKLRVEKIFTSPVIRAYQTASIIGERLGLIPIVDMRLRERGLGELNNTRITDYHWKIKLYQGMYKGVESWEEMQNRMLHFVNSISNYSVVAAVSHNDPIKSVIGHYLNMDDISMFGLVINNANMTIINTEADKPILALSTPLLSRNLLNNLRSYVK